MPVPPRLALLSLLCLPLAHAATPVNSVRRRADIPPQGYFDPNSANGSMLTVRSFFCNTLRQVLTDGCSLALRHSHQVLASPLT